MDVNTNAISFQAAPPPADSDPGNTDDQTMTESDAGSELESESELDSCVRCKKTAAVFPDDGFADCQMCHAVICFHCGGPYEYCPSCALGDVSIDGVENELQDIPEETWPGSRNPGLTREDEIFRAETLVVIEMMTRGSGGSLSVSDDADERKRLRRDLLAPVRILYERRRQDVHAGDIVSLVRARDSFCRGDAPTPEFLEWYADATKNVANAAAEMLCAAGVRVQQERVTAIANVNIEHRRRLYGW